MYRFAVALMAVTLITAHSRAADWQSLLEKVDAQANAVQGDWQKDGKAVVCEATDGGAKLTLPVKPTSQYDVKVAFTRNTGVHSIAIIFPTNQGQATMEVDAWGEHVAGFQQINGQQMNSQNYEAVARGYRLENGRRYELELQVRDNQIRGILDGKEIVTATIAGKQLTPLASWSVGDLQALAIGAWQANTTFHAVEYRPIEGSAPLKALPESRSRVERPATSRTTVQEQPARENRPAQPNSPTAVAPAPAAPTATTRAPANSQGKVLLVIANDGFFYREYFEPRKALEAAGYEVVVASARKQICQPHAGSGFTDGNGRVMPDISITRARAADYKAIVFAGGWGSSNFQYAFRGSYSHAAYNPIRPAAEAANRLINEMNEEGKIVGALCHGVSVLAWSRVNGKSLIEGKNVVAPQRGGPHGNYNGQTGQPPSRWNSEVNGANVSPFRSIGNPRSSADDVMVDGNIITGEDDNSAAAFGARLVELLESK